MKKLLITTILSGLLLTQNACNQEYLNPSSASQPQVVGSVDGLLTLCNGLQYRYTTNGGLSVPYNATSGGGLTTGELAVLNVGNINEANLSTGAGNVTPDNSVVGNLWTQNQLVRANAELILANIGIVTEAGTKSGIVAYASIFRALALGTLAEFFQAAPITSGTNAPFVDRIALLNEAVSTLEAAATQVAAAPVSANFNLAIAPGIDIPNTIQALIARYALLAGNNDKAIAAAAKVSLTSKSVFNFDDNTRNPLFEAAFGNKNVFEPTDVNFGLKGALAPETGDQRVPFYTRANPTNTQNRGTGFYTANNAPIPVYLPGEILLIQAEAYARKGDLANAVTFVNRVRTKTPAQDAFGVGAGLPAYSGPVTADAVLTEIYKNRQIELAFQGFRLEDSRRFGRPGPGAAGAERNRNFFPYPNAERINNTATPADPAN